jgi:hypothetical protein
MRERKNKNGGTLSAVFNVGCRLPLFERASMSEKSTLCAAA